ncbi:alpha-L-rhamnosidase [bacterium A37T11]|nr:alpha-L-rhamnosidase [bacterium A37T11]
MKLSSLFIILALVAFRPAMAQQPTVQPQWKAQWLKIGYTDDLVNRPGQYFRKSFETGKNIRSARLLITSHGLYEARINGHRVGDGQLTPGWTSYNKRLQYQVYDVTRLLAKGKNALAVVLGDGWYRGALAWGQDNRNHYGNELALLAQLEITYNNGKKEILVSDGSWKSATGAITSASIYNGESIDHRQEKNGWDTPSFDDKDWKAVTLGDYGYSTLIPTENQPVKKHETLHAVKVIKTPKGEQVIDFGQNLVGWVQVKAQGNAGDQITIRHAEVLDKEGNFYTDNLRAAKATATYTLSGGGPETFEPHFTFYGFRYIKVDGYPGELKPEDFTAVTLYSDMKPSGTFECSNPLLNQLQHNIQWGQRGNFLDVPTDCPQRDERLGWTGDAQAFCRTAAYNYDVQYFFRKWMKDVAADQLPDGKLPHVIPDVLHGEGGSTGWADVTTIVPWTMYEVYADKKILEDQYPSMKAWVGYMEKHMNPSDLWAEGDHFGDWLSYRPGNDGGSEAVTDKFQIAQCFFAYSTQLVINAAQVLGKTDDVARYEALLQRVKAAFLKEYVTPSGRLMSNTQTAYVLALQFDMLPENLRPVAAGYLVDNIKRYGNHLTTGFLGTPYLCHVLSRFGYTDVAYTLLLQDTFPSWLYPVKKGATTIWERWDGIKPDGSFQTPGMNSFNHYAYGAIGDWMYQHIAGIQIGAPGYKKIIIKPEIGGGITWAKASYDTPQGKVSSNWKLESGKVNLQVDIPQGATATVYVPSADGKSSKAQEVGPGSHTF